MTVTRNPHLFQCLAAEEKEELEASPEFVLMNDELEFWRIQPPSRERDRRRR
jgi:hypothetical protein